MPNLLAAPPAPAAQSPQAAEPQPEAPGLAEHVQAFIGLLKAGYELAHTAHLIAKSGAFAGDHELYEEVYTFFLDSADATCEYGIDLFGAEVVDPVAVHRHVLMHLEAQPRPIQQSNPVGVAVSVAALIARSIEFGQDLYAEFEQDLAVGGFLSDFGMKAGRLRYKVNRRAGASALRGARS